MKIYLDDIRETPEGWMGAKNFDEFKNLIETNKDKIEAISFDNDLGDGEKEGWEILKWLSENYPNYFNTNIDFEVHSANPVANEKMREMIKHCQDNVDELIEAKESPDPWKELKIK